MKKIKNDFQNMHQNLKMIKKFKIKILLLYKIRQ